MAGVLPQLVGHLVRGTGMLLTLLFVAGGAAVVIFARAATGDRSLMRLVAGAYGLRAAVAVALYAASAQHWPWLRPLQLEGGFWTFAPDALYFDHYARAALAARAAQLPLPYISGAPDYPLLVLALYRVVAVHPLVAVLLNIVVATAAMVPAFAVARDRWSPSSGRAAAAILGFWPSAVLWSTQVLKDALSVALVIGAVWIVHRVLRREGAAASRLAGLGLVAGAGVLVFVSARLRPYVGAALAGATLATVAWVWLRGDRRRAILGVMTAVVMVGAVVTSRWVPEESLGKAVDPRADSRRLARYFVEQGDLEVALSQLQTALMFETSVPPDSIAVTARRQLEQMQRDVREGRPSDVTATGPARSSDPSTPLATPLASAMERRREMDQRYGGAPDEESPLGSGGEVLRMAPAALARGLLSPNPWIRQTRTGTTGAFYYLAMIETGLTLVLIGFAVRGVSRGWRVEWPFMLFITVFSVGLLTLLGIAIPNVGTLFRVRLIALAPLALVAVASRPAAAVEARS